MPTLSSLYRCQAVPSRSAQFELWKKYLWDPPTDNLLQHRKANCVLCAWTFIVNWKIVVEFAGRAITIERGEYAKYKVLSRIEKWICEYDENKKCTIFNSAHDLSSGHRNAGSLTAGCVVSVKSSWMSLDFYSRATLGSNLTLFLLCNKKWFFPQLCAQVFFLFIDMRWKCDLMSLFRSRCTYVIESQNKVFAQKRQKVWKITSWFRLPIPCL